MKKSESLSNLVNVSSVIRKTGIQPDGQQPKTSKRSLPPEAQAFFDLIFSAIAGKKPDFQDDFNSANRNWEVGIKIGIDEDECGCDYVAGEFLFPPRLLKVIFLF